MGKKVLKAVSYILLAVVFAAPIAGTAYVLTQNTISIQNINSQLNAVSVGTDHGFKMAADTLRSHRKAILRLRKDAKVQRDEMKSRGELTDAMAYYYNRVFKELQGRLAAVNAGLKELGASLDSAIDASGEYARAQTAKKAMYDNSLRASVLIHSEYFHGEKVYPEDPKATPKPSKVAGSTGSGTVFKVTKNNTYILTAAHVVEDYAHDAWTQAEDKTWKTKETFITPVITVKNFLVDINRIESYKAVVVAFDKEADLAIIMIGGYRFPYAVAELATENDIKNIALHDEVYITGCPLGVTPRITEGRITAWIHARKGYIEANADVIWGNSGGAMFKNGKIIGVVSNGYIERYEMQIRSLGFCVSPKVISKFMKMHSGAIK